VHRGFFHEDFTISEQADRAGRAVQDMLSQGAGVSGIASATGLTCQTIYRIKDDPAEPEAIMAKWEREAA
jgi:DNA invertase Pin-like site-specific DNA recombinase